MEALTPVLKGLSILIANERGEFTDAIQQLLNSIGLIIMSK